MRPPDSQGPPTHPTRVLGRRDWLVSDKRRPKRPIRFVGSATFPASPPSPHTRPPDLARIWHDRRSMPRRLAWLEARFR
jgi:hypothetical protein